MLSEDLRDEWRRSAMMHFALSFEQKTPAKSVFTKVLQSICSAFALMNDEKFLSEENRSTVLEKLNSFKRKKDTPVTLIAKSYEATLSTQKPRSQSVRAPR